MNKILNLIRESNSILLLTHEHPDGDAIGSVMAMYHVLNDMNKKVDVVIPTIPPVFDFLITKNILSKSDQNYDLVISLDCATKERLGQENDEFDGCEKKIVIDHHVSNSKYGDINHIEGNISSCCQVLYYLFKSWKINLTKVISEALITGLLTDTNGFSNDNVDKKSFLMVAELFDSGINFHNIYYNSLTKKSMAQHLLMKLATNRLEFFEDGKIVFTYITKEDFLNFNAKLGDHEGIVDIGRNIDGVEVSIFIREESEYHISLRSNGNVNVSNIAAKFGGGGHPLAAGAKSSNTFEETKKSLIDETIKELYK